MEEVEYNTNWRNEKEIPATAPAQLNPRGPLFAHIFLDDRIGRAYVAQVKSAATEGEEARTTEPNPDQDLE